MAQNQNDLKKMNVAMKSKGRLKPEYLACLKKKKSLNSDEKKLHRAIVTNNTEAVEKFLELGVDPNASDNLLRSPLHLAASRGYKDIISLLIKYGADPNQKDVIGNTALHLAACGFTNNMEIVTLLLDAGTDVSSLDHHGRNPLQLARSKLRLLQNSRRNGTVELIQLRIQLQQVIDLMLSYLRRQQTNVESLELIKLKLDESTDSQLDDQVSILLTAIQDMSLK